MATHPRASAMRRRRFLGGSAVATTTSGAAVADSASVKISEDEGASETLQSVFVAGDKRASYTSLGAMGDEVSGTLARPEDSARTSCASSLLVEAGKSD